ncbi:hypothetical protein IAR55_002813 [Kwoniella newhampshirensis]|uniref:Mtf2-like C-terminal domain-containing protein n=1 Tax=Kwoniella newhampshirensis TaxID=1651941 RepID=A0AAW0YZE4_9TREE
MLTTIHELRACLRSIENPPIGRARYGPGPIRRYVSSSVRLNNNDDNVNRPSTPSDESTPRQPEDVPSSDAETFSGESGSGVSRDMTHSAESSSTPNAGIETSDAGSENNTREVDPGVAEEDRQFAQLFDTLREKWPKARSSSPISDSPANINININNNNASPLPRPQSIASRLTSSFDTPSPRAPRGVHSRQRRSAGQTPQEAETFNKILSDIFSDLQSSVSSPTPSSRSGLTSASSSTSGRFGTTSTSTSTSTDSFATTTRGGFGFGLGLSGDRAKGLRKLFDRDGDEESDESVEELEMLKEEMEVIGSDVELLEWAKNRVFKPVPAVATTGSASVKMGSSGSLTPTTSAVPSSTISPETSSSASTPSTPPTLPPILTFSRAYPKILAHLLKTLRVNYNSPHLLLAIFHHAQTCSLESYLSGCLTAAYNEVLICRWESFRDLEGVEAGIREMEIMGVEWDAGTARIVSRVVEQVSKDVLASTSSNSTGNGGGGGSGRWGEEVLERLGRLEKKVQKDVRNQERYFENTQKTKRRAREEREMRLEREQREGRREEEFSRMFG